MSLHGALFGLSMLPVMLALCTSAQGAAADDEKYLNDRYSRVIEVCPYQRMFVSGKDFQSGMYPRYADRIKADPAAGHLDPEEDGPGGYMHAYTLSLTSPELYLCSGLMVRGTRQVLPAGLNAWDPYPQGRTADTSFTYLRADIKMTRLAWSYTNGFIITATPALKVNCFYPLDAQSDQRLNNGCGPFRDDASTDPQCGDNATMSDEVPVRARCRYDLGRLDGVAQFAKGVAAAARTSLVSDTPNDLKVETWKPGCDQRLQIRAFFYVNAEGKAFAERDRKQYEDVCKQRVALVHLKFPENKDGRITFTVQQ